MDLSLDDIKEHFGHTQRTPQQVLAFVSTLANDTVKNPPKEAAFVGARVGFIAALMWMVDPAEKFKGEDYLELYKKLTEQSATVLSETTLEYMLENAMKILTGNADAAQPSLS